MRRMLLLVPLLAACGGGDTPPDETIEPKLSVIEQRIFGPSCATAACHSTGNAANAGQLDLTPGKSFASLVGVAAKNAGAVDEALLLVKPGEAAKSFLFLKVKPTVPIAYGTRMPQNTAPLSDVQRKAIEEWIAKGALND